MKLYWEDLELLGATIYKDKRPGYPGTVFSFPYQGNHIGHILLREILALKEAEIFEIHKTDPNEKGEYNTVYLTSLSWEDLISHKPADDYFGPIAEITVWKWDIEDSES